MRTVARDHFGVLVGGACGALARWWLSAHLWPHAHFPFAVLVINVTGALVLGLLHPLMLGGRVPAAVRLAATTGFLGGYTTFSTWMLGSAVLWTGGAPLAAALYVVASLLLGVMAAAAGMAAARWMQAGGRDRAA